MTIPNILTIIRLISTPVFAVVFICGGQKLYFVSLFIFIFACFLDLVDGYIARKYNMITDLGKVLDPIADKVLVITVLVCLRVTGALDLWFLYFIIIKECLMVLGGILLYKGNKVVVKSNIFGKLATVFMFMFLVDSLTIKVGVAYFQLGAVITTALAFVCYGVNFFEIKSGKTNEIHDFGRKR